MLFNFLPKSFEHFFLCKNQLKKWRIGVVKPYTIIGPYKRLNFERKHKRYKVA
jgi:hypothetical protein